MSVYDVSPETVGMFDVVFFFGTLYHLRHPLLALDKLPSVCKERSTSNPRFSTTSALTEEASERDIPTTRWSWSSIPTINTETISPTVVSHPDVSAQMVRVAGFPDSQGWKLTVNQPTELPHCRGFVKGKKNA